MDELDAILARLTRDDCRPGSVPAWDRRSDLAAHIAQALESLAPLQILLGEWVPDAGRTTIRPVSSPRPDPGHAGHEARGAIDTPTGQETSEAFGRPGTDPHQDRTGQGDIAVLKSSLDTLCSILSRDALRFQSDVPALLRDLSERIGRLDERAAPLPADPRPVLNELARLNDRMTALDDEWRHRSLTLEALAERLSADMRAMAEAPSARLETVLQRLERLDDGMSRVARQADPSPVERTLRTIGETLERRPHPDDGAIDRRSAPAAELRSEADQEPVRTLAAEAAAHLESLRSQAETIAEMAARMGAGDARGRAATESGLNAVKESLVEIKALHLRSDRKIQQALQGIQEALETVIARSPPHPERPPEGHAESGGLPADRLEAAVRRLQAVAMSQVDEAASAHRPEPPAGTVVREEHRPLLRDAAGTESEPRGRFGASFSPPPHEAGGLRASFIAAARRATQSVVATEVVPVPPAAPGGADGARPDDDPAREAERLIDRLKRTLDNHKRPLALAWAALLLGCGAIPFAPDIAHARASLEASSSVRPILRSAESGNCQLPFTPGAL